MALLQSQSMQRDRHGWRGWTLYTALGLLAACASNGNDTPAQPDAGGQVNISGTVLYRERMALPSGSVVEVLLEDTALADAPAKVLAQQTITPQGQVPIPFQLSVDRAVIDRNARPSLRVSIKEAGGQLIFTTVSHETVDLSQDTRDRELILQRVPRSDGKQK